MNRIFFLFLALLALSIFPTDASAQELDRIAGDNRYETSLEFSKRIPANRLDYVIVTSGNNFPDSLAGGVLSSTLNGNVILVDDSKVSKVITEAERVLKSNGKVLILGGEMAVSKNVENALKKHFIVERIGGVNRVDTSIKIADRVNTNPSEIIIVSGNNFADALSIVPYAALQFIPILLNTDSNDLNQEIKDYIEAHSTSKVTIIGGEAAVPNQAQKYIENRDIVVERVAGSSRYDTSLAIANTYFPGAKKTGIASGINFPDALSGSGLALRQSMPIILTHPVNSNNTVLNYMKKMDSLYVFGGEAALPNKAVGRYTVLDIPFNARTELTYFHKDLGNLTMVFDPKFAKDKPTLEGRGIKTIGVKGNGVAKSYYELDDKVIRHEVFITLEGTLEKGDFGVGTDARISASRKREIKTDGRLTHIDNAIMDMQNLYWDIVYLQKTNRNGTTVYTGTINNHPDFILN
ncbi:cell wall-binding repeat-containing protein [Mesobacillus jeotgali]|uniref:cell wall-binding repeat-containing protein n=1 Tax=Mesobacillus jeotgali TaxID=129985 RepID=UPI000C8507B0|nr:cell wall-binding repeat-containing protein [Mesobacillus jeotgali]